MAGAAKEAEALARRVRAAGYECERNGHAYLVRPRGGGAVIVRFSAHASHPRFWIPKAERDLVRAGVLEPREHHRRSKREKEEPMAAITGADKKASSQLVGRIREYLAEHGGDNPKARTALAQGATRMIEEGRTPPEVEQFGSMGSGKSRPEDIARNSMANMLDREMGATGKSVARWNEAIDALEREEQNGRGDATAIPPPLATVPEPEPEIGATSLDVGEAEPGFVTGELAELREYKETAEQLVADAEAEARKWEEKAKGHERDHAAADRKLKQAREDLKANAAALASAERELAARPTVDEEERELERQLAGLREDYARLLRERVADCDGFARALPYLDRLDALSGISGERDGS
jgi:hypothetical protein